MKVKLLKKIRSRFIFGKIPKETIGFYNPTSFFDIKKKKEHHLWFSDIEYILDNVLKIINTPFFSYTKWYERKKEKRQLIKVLKKYNIH